MSVFKILLLPGDGIGPEISAEAEKVLAFLNEAGVARFEVAHGLVGGAAYDAHGVAISEADMKLAQAADAVLLAAVGGPKWDGVPYDVRPEAGLLDNLLSAGKRAITGESLFMTHFSNSGSG